MKTLKPSNNINKSAGALDLDRYRYVFFDFDGVIMDTEHIKVDGFVKLYEEYGKSVTDKVLKHHHVDGGGGISRYVKFKLYHKEFLGVDLTEDQIEEYAGKYSQIVYDQVLKAEYIQGVSEFLKLCKRHKKICFLVSATPEAEIKRIAKAKKVEKYFREIKGSPRVKEKNIKDLMTKYKIDNKKAVFFGDSISDLKAANSNDIKFIGINCSDAAINYPNFKELLSGGA